METAGRRHCIPIIYTKGTHYEVGYDVGRTFRGLIQNYVKNNKELNVEMASLIATPEGQKLYDDTLASVKTNFPQYVRELEGIAHGSETPFEKLFMLNMGQMIAGILSPAKDQKTNGSGCSSICVNEPNAEILGHTEDAYADIFGHFYLVSAHITEDEPQGKWKTKEEKFVSLCYPGILPGYTMNYNQHGLVYSINLILARDLSPGKTPEYFLCRALLAAQNLQQVEDILRDKGTGAAVGVSVNLTFLDEPGDRVFYNFEVAAASPPTDESVISKMKIEPGNHSFHCNKYLRLKTPEIGGMIIESSDARQHVLDELKPPKTKKEVIRLLSHQVEDNFTIFRDYSSNDVKAREPIATIAVGIFDCVARTWSIYADKPEKNEPLVVIPLETLCGEQFNTICHLAS